jgi:hypothetical protein
VIPSLVNPGNRTYSRYSPIRLSIWIQLSGGGWAFVPPTPPPRKASYGARLEGSWLEEGGSSRMVGASGSTPNEDDSAEGMGDAGV